ncbi:MAG: N-acetyltransferase [Ilumatobacteraceae bacterium]|nr:N-acetyltransferase [Ilumatobacteraceae bacterium]
MADVQNEVSNNRLTTTVDGHLAELVYRQVGRRLILIHTGVPDELSGRGVGGDLVRAAVDWAEEEALVVVPKCPFANAWLRKHPDEAARVDIDWAAAEQPE